MKQGFIRILSPITITVSFAFDAAAVWLTIFVIKELIEKADGTTIIFAVMVAFAAVLAVFYNKEVFSNGIILYEDRFEFNGLDENNVIYFRDIESIEVYKDTKASLKKNFNERHSLIIFNLKNETIHTIDIGLTTNKALNKISKKLDEHRKLKNSG